MRIVHSQPPNIGEIIRYLNPPKSAVFPYGGVIYNPSGGEIYPDIIFHEKVHDEQQKKFGGSDRWWGEYLSNKAFRLSQEIEAYSKQLYWLKIHGLQSGGVKGALDEASIMLERYYDLGYNSNELATMLRKAYKNLVEQNA